MDGMGSDELISSVPNFARGLDILLVDHETASLMYLASLLEQYTFKGISKNILIHHIFASIKVVIYIYIYIYLRIFISKNK